MNPDTRWLAFCFVFSMGMILLLLFAVRASAQDPPGVLRGPNTPPAGAVLQPAPVQAPALAPPSLSLQPIAPLQIEPLQPGVPIYLPGECIGAIVNGVCRGSVIDTNPQRPRCHGVLMPDGSCTGPVF